MKNIILFELKYYFRRPSVYIYWLLMFLLGFWLVSFLGSDNSGNMLFFDNDGKTFVNSSFTIYRMLIYAGYYGLLILAPIMGSSMARDFEHQLTPFVFTSPISKTQLLTGKFIGSILVALIVFTGIGIGIKTATFMPWINAERLCSDVAGNYLMPYLLLVVPNILIFGAIFFSLTALTRKMMATYTASIILVILLTVSQQLLKNMDSAFIASSLDAFGNSAFKTITKYWTISDKNTLAVPITINLLLNRIIWLSTGLALFVFTLKKFKLQHSLSEKKKKVTKSEPAEPARVKAIKIMSPVFDLKHKMRLLFSLTGTEFRNVAKNIYFLIILLVGIVMTLVAFAQIGSLYETETYPITYQVTEIFSALFEFIFYLIIIVYSGEMIWRERKYKLDGINDASPLTNGLKYLSKFMALMGVVFLILCVLLVCGITLQLSQGFYEIDFRNYLVELFVINFSRYFFIAVLAFFIQIVINNRYFGFAVMGVFYIADKLLYDFFPNNTLAHFSAQPPVTYSDMNGYAHFLSPVIWHIVYWTAFSIILMVVSAQLWVHGNGKSLRWRVQVFRENFNRNTKIILLSAAGVFIACGLFIYYNTHVLNDYETSDEIINRKAQYEIKYRKYLNLQQPKPESIFMNAEIYPRKKSVHINGHYWLCNKSSNSIDTLAFEINRRAIVDELVLDHPANIIVRDKNIGFYMFRLVKPLAPNDSIQLKFSLNYENRGFKSNEINTDIVSNGSLLLNTDYLPTIGYSSDNELKQRSNRRKYGLNDYNGLPERNEQSIQNGLFNYAHFEAIIGTSKDQMAFTSGELLDHWQENGRSYFHYRSKGKMINYFPLISGKYEVYKDQLDTVPIRIYYHKNHPYNVKRMAEAAKQSLKYFTANFGPYPYNKIKIVEFPRYFFMAVSFPDIIPFSEDLGFIAKVEEDDLDYVSRIVAHEMSHTYWGHVVYGAKVKGMPMLMEPLAQYSSLMVMEKQKGQEKVQNFLKLELDDYLKARGRETNFESSLQETDMQKYLWYEKGTLSMFSIKEYFGEDWVNSVLKQFYLESVKTQKPRISTELIDLFKENAPDSLQYLITDWFEKITLYENKVEGASYRESNGKYIVTVELNLAKFEADGIGKQTRVKLNDYIEIAIQDKKGKNVYQKKLLFTGENLKISMETNEEPAFILIDPQTLLIDKNREDNKRKIVKTD